MSVCVCASTTLGGAVIVVCVCVRVRVGLFIRPAVRAVISLANGKKEAPTLRVRLFVLSDRRE